MLQRNPAINGYLTETNRKMRKKFINVGVETEKDKDYYNYFSTRNKDNYLKFPNIKIYNGTQTKYNPNLISNIAKNIYFNTELTESENDIPKIRSKINKDKNKNFFSNSVKKCNNCFNSLRNNCLEDVDNSNLVVSSIKTPKLNILDTNNISNINNIYSKKDFVKNYINSSNEKTDNNNRTSILIKKIKNSESNISLNEDEKNTILNLLMKKTTIKIKNKTEPKQKKLKPKHKDEFKEFLKEILKQHKDKNLNRVKKKIDINMLLNNKHIKSHNNINIAKKYNSNFNEKNSKKMKTCFNDYKKQHRNIMLRNEFLNSQLNHKNYGMLTEELKDKKRNIYDIYRFKRNKKIMNKVEEELINLENKIKKSFDIYKKNIDDEPNNFL
jgi:hypothetical protein